jgi:hypothetical protein
VTFMAALMSWSNSWGSLAIRWISKMESIPSPLTGNANWSSSATLLIAVPEPRRFFASSQAWFTLGSFTQLGY